MDTGGGTSGREASIWRKRAIFLNYRPSLGETMPTRDVGLWEEGRDYSKKIRVDLITTTYTTTAAFSSPTRRKRVSAGSYIMTPMSSLRCIFPLNDGWQLVSRGGEGEGSIDKSYVDDGARGSIEIGKDLIPARSRLRPLHDLGSGRCTICWA